MISWVVLSEDCSPLNITPLRYVDEHRGRDTSPLCSMLTCVGA